MDQDESSNGSNDSSDNVEMSSPEQPQISSPVPEYSKPVRLDSVGSLDGPESPSNDTPMSPDDETPMSPDETPMSPDEPAPSPGYTPMSPGAPRPMTPDNASQSGDESSQSSRGGSSVVKSIEGPQSPDDNPRSPSPDNPRSSRGAMPPPPPTSYRRSPSPDNQSPDSSPSHKRTPATKGYIRSPSPDNIHSPSPEGGNPRSPSPADNPRSPSPENVRSPSPFDNPRSPSPDNPRSPSPDNVRSPSPDDNVRSPSPDNVRSPSPQKHRSPRSFERGVKSSESSSSPQKVLYKAPIKVEHPQSLMKDKPMDSKTVETLEGELDFEEEVQEKEEEPLIEEKENSVIIKDEIGDESLVVVKTEKKKEEEEDDDDDGEVKSPKPKEVKERKLIKMDQPSKTNKSDKTDQEEGEADDGEVTDEDDLEEGEVKDGTSVRKGFPRPNCRFFNKGQCTWGSSCRFIHPGVNDKGNYNMFAAPKPSMPASMMMMPGPPPPMPPPMPMMKMPPLPPHPRMRPMMGPDFRPFPPMEEPPPVESAWERGLRHAKEIMKKANRRKEQETDFEEKRMNLSIENPDRIYERDMDKYGPSYRRPSEPGGYYKDDIDDPYDNLEEREIQERWRGGHYENFEVRWNRPDFDREFHDKERQRRYPRSMEREKFERRSPEPERWQDERYREAQAPRGRADEWQDPWRRSKTPKGRRSRSQPRSGRRSYSSGSSRSYSSSSSRSSFDSRSSYSKSSHFGSERSRSRSHPRAPSREGAVRPGFRYNKSPPATGGRSFERDLYEPRRRAPPPANMRDPLMRSPTLARNSSPPTRPPIGRGPSPVHNIVDLSPPSKFSPTRRTPPPRKMNSPNPSSKKQLKNTSPIRVIRQSPPMPKRQYPIEGKQKQRKSPPMERKKQPKVGPKSPSPLSPPPMGARLRDPSLMMKTKERKHAVPPVPKTSAKAKPDFRERKALGGTHSGSESSHSASRSPSRSSHTSSQSRSRSRSISRSVSMSSVSSVSSSISHSSSGSETGKTKSKAKALAKGIPAAVRRPPGDKVPPAKKDPALGGGRVPAEAKGKERPPKESKRAHDRHFTEFDDHPKASSYDDPTSLTIPLMVSKQSKDLIKQGGQKAPIKLNLLAKQQKQSTLDKSPVKTDNRPNKHQERVGEDGSRPKTSSLLSGSRKRPASPTHKKGGALALSIAAAKATNSRREELLKQLKAVEDAIARKKSKPN